MPECMLLRSPWEGSHIGDPRDRFTLDVYRTLNGNRHLADPIPRKDFVKYGQWVHQQAGLSADRRKVTRIELAPQGYQLNLENGQALCARRVVVAGGIQPFTHRPKMFESLPASLVTHTSEHRDFAAFQGKEVMVIGGGQSALEAAAFLFEAGAQVDVLVRNSAIRWLRRHPWVHSKWISWLFYGPGDIGPAGISLAVQRPGLYRRLPRSIQDRWAARSLRPAGARWLKPRVQNVAIHTDRMLYSARPEGERLRVRWNDGTERTVDHVVLGTGYRINIALYPFLPSEILRRIDAVEGYPRLGAGFESSLPGLHFLGAPAAWSYGPLLRFVAGTGYASHELRGRIVKARIAHRALQPTSGLPMDSLRPVARG